MKTQETTTETKTSKAESTAKKESPTLDLERLCEISKKIRSIHRRGR